MLQKSLHLTEMKPSKRLPEINKYTGDYKTLIILNESVLDLLKDNLRMVQERMKQERKDCQKYWLGNK